MRWYITLALALLAVGLGCSRPSSTPVPANSRSPSAAMTPPPAVPALKITSSAMARGLNGGTQVLLAPEKFYFEILVDEGDESVIAVGTASESSIKDLSFIAITGEGNSEKEIFAGTQKSQFGSSQSWVFKSGRLVELLRKGRDARVTLNATTNHGTQAATEELLVSITWPAQRPATK